MYEELFESPARPFRATPDAKFYFPHDSIETARQTVVRAVKRAEGPVLVLGGAGLGKSLLGEIVAGQLQSQFDIVKLRAARVCSRKALLQNILFELQMPYRDLSEGELRLSILDRMEPEATRRPGGLLIVVDEAHTLHAKLLEELRLLTNFSRGGEPRARLLLIGNMRLEDTFASPQMESFNQRLAARCYLTPMSREQTSQYVQHQIAAAGYKPHEFITSEGLATVYAASEGVPRLANQIMDHALVLAITNNQVPVSAALVEEAWADLQQLPAPWESVADRSDAAANASQAVASIEFGSLDGEDSESELQFVETALQTRQPSDFAETETESNDGLNHDDEASDDLTYDEVGATDEVVSTNFFAAFSQPGQDELPAGIEFDNLSKEPSDEREQQLELDPKPKAEIAAKPEAREPKSEVVFNAAQAMQKAQRQTDSPLDSQECAKAGVDNNCDCVEPEEEQRTAVLSFDAQANVADDSNYGDVFFADRPTDEKMLALSDEQDQYDAMGVWENDPPIAEEDRATEQSVAQEANQVDREQTESRPASPVADAAQLFGDDFDEELSIGSQSMNVADFSVRSFSVEDLVPSSVEPTVEAKPEPEPEPKPKPVVVPASDFVAESAFEQVAMVDDDCPINMLPEEYAAAKAELAQRAQSSRASETAQPVDDSLNDASDAMDTSLKAALVAEHLQRIQEFADSMVGDGGMTVDGVLHAMPGSTADALAGNDPADVLSTWSTQVAAMDVSREKQLQNEIEDIVSQLNFSAFAVEPFSVEQIQIDSQPRANSRGTAPEDSIRGGTADEIYIMHRANAGDSDERLFSDESAQFDDDRDLLIVEEELPVSRAVNDSQEQKVTKATPYTQLFSKLRK